MCCEMLFSGHGIDTMKSHTQEITVGWISAQDHMSWTSSLGFNFTTEHMAMNGY